MNYSNILFKELGLKRRCETMHEMLKISSTDISLEISPLFAPILPKDMFNVKYCDYISYENLKERELNNQSMLEKNLFVQPIDFIISKNEDIVRYALENGKFKYIVSSHVFEHVPDLLGMLRSIANSLVIGGQVGFVIPDSTGGGEFYRGLSSTAEVIEACLYSRRMPTFSQIFDATANEFEFDPNLRYQDIAYNDQKVKYYNDINSCLQYAFDGIFNYRDCHCWAFSFESIQRILNELIGLGLLPFEIQEVRRSQIHACSGSTDIYVALKFIDNYKFNKNFDLISALLGAGTINSMIYMKIRNLMTENDNLGKAAAHGEKAFWEAMAVIEEFKARIAQLESK